MANTLQTTAGPSRNSTWRIWRRFVPMRWSAPRHAPKSLGKGTSRGEGLGSSGDEPWTGRIGAKPQLAEEVTSGTSHYCTPVDMMGMGSEVANDTRFYSRHCYGNPECQGMRKGKSGFAQDRARRPRLSACHDERGNRVGSRPLWSSFHQVPT